MTRHRHTARSLAADYIRAGAGFALTAGPALFAPTAGPVFWVLFLLAAVFAIYAASVAFRHASVIEVSDTGIAVTGPVSRSIRWHDLREMRLKYFSTRRDGAQGWMQLVLKGSDAIIRIESTLGGFADIVKRAAKAANDEGINLSRTTLGNLELLGVKSEVVTSTSGSP